MSDGKYENDQYAPDRKRAMPRCPECTTLTRRVATLEAALRSVKQLCRSVPCSSCANACIEIDKAALTGASPAMLSGEADSNTLQEMT